MVDKSELIAAMTDDSAHHLFSLSGSSQWLSCGMSVWEQFGMPDTTSDAAIEGTRAHDFAEKCLKLRHNAYHYADQYPEEMVENVQKYLDFVLDTIGQYGKMWIEQRVDLSRWILGGRGTADVIGLAKEGDKVVLHVIDLKYGKGVKVEARENSQGKLYGGGALEAMRKAGKKIDLVVIHIAQPRLNNWDSWEIDPDELMEWMDYVSNWVELCLDKKVDYNPSERACQWCKAQATCTALYKHNVAIVSKDFEPIAPQNLTDEQLKLVIDNKALIEKWLKSVEAHVFSKLEHGEQFPGYKMVEGRSIRKWTDNAEEVLAKMLGDDAYEKKLINITAAEKLIGKKHFNELGLTFKPEGKPTLAPESDKRKALPTISDDFENLETEKE